VASTAGARRREIHTRERILDEAEDLIERHGYDGLRLRDIADPIGIQVPSIYAHYEGRGAVVAGVVKRFLDSLNDQFAYDGRTDPTSALLDGIRGLARDWADHPAYVRLCLRGLEYTPGLPEAQRQLEVDVLENLLKGPIGGMIQRLHAILERGHELGEFRKIDVIRVYRHILVAMLGIFTVPTQRLLSRAAPRAELELAIREVEELVLRLLRSD
jgi:AcrR family transcriptional regulator